MAGAPGFQKIERLGPTHLADRNAVGPKAERRADEIGERRDTIPGPHRDEVGCGALEFARVLDQDDAVARSEEHTSELPSLMRISYAVCCLKKKTSSIFLQAARPYTSTARPYSVEM